MRMTTLRAYAKINWGLEVLGRRDDGYHEIRTVTHTISLADEVTVELGGEGISLSVSGDWPAPDDRANICWQAAEAFAEKSGMGADISIGLRKRIPAQAGLGGGSSDCVAVLAALAGLTGRVARREELIELAAQLGSDTALFVDGGAALCSGRGEIIAPIDCSREYHLVIARPEGSVCTAGAYALLTPEDFSDGAAMDALAADLARGAEPEELGAMARNAFSRKIMAQHPAIERLLGAVIEAGALGGEMTGSGSAVFGVARDAAHAAELAEEIQQRGSWARAVHTTDQGHEAGGVPDEQ